jgi:RsiW-degrading membrane proteinase PrsW (M82 family)
MNGPIVLPVGVSIGIVAFLLSLLPAVFFLWMWYLRNRDRSLPAASIALAFGVGALIVQPAFWLEKGADSLWRMVSPATEHYYGGTVLPLLDLKDLLLPAFATFCIVALVEEGLRYAAMRFWMKRSRTIDQVFDGLLIGVAIGLGFSTLENTLYFKDLLHGQDYDTLVFVFFLRFMISTLAHISFSGIMGALIAQGTFHLFRSRAYMIAAFLIPWFLHGLFDLLLGVGHGLYAVLVLLPALITLVLWTFNRQFFIIHRQEGKFLAVGKTPESPLVRALSKALQREQSPWNVNAPWLNQNKSYRAIFNAMGGRKYE